MVNDLGQGKLVTQVKDKYQENQHAFLMSGSIKS